MKSPLSKQEWDELATKARLASEAISAFQFALLQGALKAEASGDLNLSTKFLNEADNIRDASLPCNAYMFTPQSEWLGGEQWTLREPHFAHVLPRRTVL